MKRFRLKRRVVVDGTLNKRALAKADTTPVALPAGAANLPQNPPAPAPKATKEGEAAPSSPLDKLNPKQVAFIEHYMATANGTEAAIKAGYSKHSAHAQGTRLLNDAVVSSEIRRRKDSVLERSELTFDLWLAEQRSVGFANMGDYMRPGADGEPRLDFRGLTRAQTAALREVTVEEFTDGRSDKRQVRRIKFRLHDKQTALDAIGKHFGWLNDKVDHKHTHEGAIGLLLKEIDEAGRQRKLIDVTPETGD